MRKFLSLVVAAIALCTTAYAQSDSLCPQISIAGPAGVTSTGDTLTFIADVAVQKPSELQYEWRISSGTIESGQGTAVVVVRTFPDTEEDLIATVEVEGLPGHCTNSASYTAKVSPPPACGLPIDEWSAVSPKVEKYHLFNDALYLKRNPNTKALYIIYVASDETRSSVEKRLKRIRTFLIDSEKIEATRVFFLFADGDATRTAFYLWALTESTDNFAMGFSASDHIEKIRPAWKLAGK